MIQRRQASPAPPEWKQCETAPGPYYQQNEAPHPPSPPVVPVVFVVGCGNSWDSKMKTSLLAIHIDHVRKCQQDEPPSPALVPAVVVRGCRKLWDSKMKTSIFAIHMRLIMYAN